MEIELRALVNEVRRLVFALETSERRKEIEKITSRGDKKDMFTEEWEESKPIIQKNFESWRDYLYKYALVLVSVLGFLTTLIATKWVGQLSIALVIVGIVCILLSILITFLSIFITLYLERKFVAANMAFTQCMQVGFHKADGQDDGRRSPMRAIEKYLGEVIVKREHDLEDLKKQRAVDGLSEFNKEKLDGEILDLGMGIKGDRRTKALMKYVGIQYTGYETARLIITIAIIILSLSGLSIIIYALMGSYIQDSIYPSIPQGQYWIPRQHFRK